MKKENKKENKIIYKDINNLPKEKIEIEIIKSKIEITKIGFDRYIETLTRSAFIETCTAGAIFNKMFHDLLKNGIEHVEELNVPKNEKTKLQAKWCFGELFGTNPSEKEILENVLKHWESLESWAKSQLKNLNYELKKKIVIDSIEQQQLWSRQFDRNSKLYKQIDELKKVKTLKKT